MNNFYSSLALTPHCQQLVVATAANAATIDHAQSVARQYGLYFVANTENETLPETGFVLRIGIEVIELWPVNASHGRISIDFIEGRSAHRRKYGGGKKQPLPKAIGLGGNSKKIATKTVLDTTAGFGSDAFVLASLGCTITLVERNPVLVCMLEQALLQAQRHEDTCEIAARMSLVHDDSVTYMKSLNIAPDTVYLDPMYPQPATTAKVKKNMQTLHRLIGQDSDSEATLLCALQSAAQRVVVKRPARSVPVQGPRPNFAVSSPNTRYDVYLVNP